MTIAIFLTINMYIRPTRILEVDSPNAKYDSKERLYEECINADWGDNNKMKEAMIANNNKDNDKEDL